jgi:hypothetical protein
MEGTIQIFGYLSEEEREKDKNVAMIAEATNIEDFNRVALNAKHYFQKYIAPDGKMLDWKEVFLFFNPDAPVWIFTILNDDEYKF